MRTINEYLNESLLDDEDDLVNDNTVLIEQFLKDNYKIDGTYTIKNGVVDAPETTFKISNLNLKQLTNGLFKFGKVRSFICTKSSITSLKGAPEEVGYFSCRLCKNLKTLEGAPKKVDDMFNCRSCDNLKSLKGAPEFIDGDFNCGNCKSLTTLKGAPKKITGEFTCIDCISLQNLDYLPEIEMNLYCDEKHIKNCKEIIEKQVKGETQSVF